MLGKIYLRTKTNNMADTPIYILPATDNAEIEDYVIATVIEEFKAQRKTYTEKELKAYRTPVEKLIDLQVQLLLVNTELLSVSDLYSEASEKDPYFADIWLDSTGVTKALSSVSHLITPIIQRSIEMMLELNKPENDHRLDILEKTSLNIANKYAEKYPDLKENIDLMIDTFTNEDVLPPVD